MEAVAKNSLLLLTVLVPIGAALLGLILRRYGILPAVLGIFGLQVSAVCCALLLIIPERFDAFEGGGARHVLASINLPESQVIGALPEDMVERRGMLADAMQQQQSEPGLLSQPVEISLLSTAPRLLFGLSSALIAGLCLLFALRERRDDPRQGRFYAVLTLFAAAMLLFIFADTLLLLFVGWELMGLCSFLLIGHEGSAKARRAATQAFWTTRVTDFGLLFAIIILMSGFGWHSFSRIDFPGLRDAYAGLQSGMSLPPEMLGMLSAVALLMLIAALGKVAAFPLSFWLSEAMVAPPAVSALLHAATMVAAGPFLLLQLAPLFAVSQVALLACVVLGGITAVLCGLMALCGSDAKRVLAYSTISQLGIAVMAVGALSDRAALYHLLSHAWFKAPLFLAAGYLAALALHNRMETAAAHAAKHSDEHEHTLLSRLAGSARRHGLVAATLIVGGLGLAGLWGTGGFWGKEQVLTALLSLGQQGGGEGPTLAQAMPLAAAGWNVGAVLLIMSIPITAAYAVRLFGLLVWSKPDAAEDKQDEDLTQTDDAIAPVQPRVRRGWTAALVATVLAVLIGTLALGLLHKIFEQSPVLGLLPWHKSEHHLLITGLSLVLFLTGGMLAWQFNVANPTQGAIVVRDGKLAPLIAFFDEGMRLRQLWERLIGAFGWLLAQRLHWADAHVIDRAVHGTARGGRRLSRWSRWFDEHVVDGARYWACEIWWLIRGLHRKLLQTGSIQHYMLIIMLSAVLLSFVVLGPMARALSEIIGRM